MFATPLTGGARVPSYLVGDVVSFWHWRSRCIYLNLPTRPGGLPFGTYGAGFFRWGCGVLPYFDL